MRRLVLVMALMAAAVVGLGAGPVAAQEAGGDGHSWSGLAGGDHSVTVTAAREPSPPNCDVGAFCAYERWPQNGYGALKLETQGNWVGGAGWVTHVFNNGVRWPGADHVQLGWVWGDGTIEETCVHYNPGPGHKISFGAPVIITRVFWRGEC